MSKMLYDVRERPRKWWEWIVFSLQQVLSVFVATVLIANICGTPVSSCLLGACVGTLLYQCITGFRSPMFISSCGATISAVLGALSLNTAGNNYLMVFMGGIIIFLVYAIFAGVVKLKGIEFFNKIFPPTIVGSITIVIGINLAAFLVTYTGQNVLAYFNANEALLTGEFIWPIVVAFVTMLTVAITSHYGKGFVKNIPFLIGLVVGFTLCLVLYFCGVKRWIVVDDSPTRTSFIDFSAFNSIRWYPDLTFLQWKTSDWSFANLGKVCLYFVPVAICALLEHYSDHKVLSNVIDHDLTVEPGLHRTLLGDGAASMVGTALCGLPNTSYGESIATTGFSKVASVWIITMAAGILGLLSFIGPVQAAIQSIPSCVFGGCAMILYGYIAASGLKTLISNKVDLEDSKNLIIVSVILTVGTSGIIFLNNAFSGVSLAMVLGVILNVILRKHEVK